MSPGGDGTGVGPADGPVRVLHVDDDPDFLDLATALLERERPDVSVTTAEGAAAGLDALAEGRFDCVVSDYDMPGADGLGFLEAVREEYPDLPFVLFTGKGSEEIASEAISAGVTDYLQKGGGREQFAVLAKRVENAVDRYRARRAVEETRRWHQRLVEESTDVILVVDPDGTISYTSPSVEGVLGYDPAETTGRNVFDFVHPDDRDAVEEAHAAVVAGEESVPPVRYQCEHADGRWVTLESRSRNLLDDPTIDGVVVYVRDVSSQRARERELDRYESVVEATGDAVYALDADGRFTLVNDAYESLTGYAAEEVLGEHVSITMREEDIERGESLIRELLRDDETSHDTFEIVIHTKDGEVIDVENHLALLEDEEGEFLGTTGVLRDVSERKARERDLERYARIVGAIGDGVYALDREGHLVEFNDYLVELTGYDREEMDGASVAMWYDDEDVERFERAIRGLLSGEGDDVETVEATLHTADGGDVAVEVNLTLLPAGDDEFQGTVGVIRDVTERRERKEQLERYETVVDRVPNGVFVLDEEGVVVDGNDTAARMVGEAPEAFVGERFDRLVEDGVVGEEILDEYPEAVRDLLSSKTDTDEATFQYDVSLNGEERVYEVQLALRPYDDEFRGTIGIVQDVTDRKERELELERYERMVEAMGDGVYVLDADGRMVEFNEFMIELTGYGREEMTGASSRLWYDEEDFERFERAIRDLLAADEGATRTVEATLHPAAGDDVIVEVNLTLLPTENGEFRGTLGVVRDVTERKERERALERYETVVEVSGDAMYALDETGHYTFVNDALAELRGYDREELLGKHVSEVLEEEDIEQGEALIRELLAGDRRSGTFEMDVVTNDGTRVPVENHVAILPMEAGEFRGTAGVLRDISERKEREETLRRQNQRLDRFAKMVSHDLRNPLNVAAGRVQMELRDNDSDNLAMAQEALSRMDDIVEDVLSLARDGREVVDPDRVPFLTCVDDAWGTVDAASASLSIDGDFGACSADASRLQQLLENLFRNAVEHAGPEVTVEVGRLDGDGPAPGGFYVEDDGPGIPEAEREDVFEFGRSTKGDGTGFGLAIVEGIADAHGWDVVATEAESGGARFEISGVEWLDPA